MVWQTLLICLFTVCWVVSHYSGHMGRSGDSPEFGTVLCHLLSAWQNMQTMLTGGSDDFFQTRVHLAILDGWFDKGQHVFELAAQMLSCKYLVDFKGATLSSASKQIWHDCVPQRESICLNRCAFTWPRVWNEGTFRLHMEQNCCHIDLLFICFAECEIASSLFVVVLPFGVLF